MHAVAVLYLHLVLLQVELLELFYASLCSLVERQRLSDPLSLTLVHKVRHMPRPRVAAPTALQLRNSRVRDL